METKKKISEVERAGFCKLNANRSPWLARGGQWRTGLPTVSAGVVWEEIRGFVMEGVPSKSEIREGNQRKEGSA
jgi:hypothetical protein